MLVVLRVNAGTFNGHFRWMIIYQQDTNSKTTLFCCVLYLVLEVSQGVRPGGVHVLLPLRHGYAEVLLHGLRQGPFWIHGDGRASPLHQGQCLCVFFSRPFSPYKELW